MEEARRVLTLERNSRDASAFACFSVDCVRGPEDQGVTRPTGLEAREDIARANSTIRAITRACCTCSTSPLAASIQQIVQNCDDFRCRKTYATSPRDAGNSGDSGPPS